MNYDPPDEPDFEEMADVPPSQPAGHITVNLPIPTPTLEQVAGEMARQMLRDANYDRPSLRSLAMDKLYETIDTAVSARARAVVEDLLERPMQRTDGYGVAVGEPVSMAAVIASRVEAWSGEIVNERDGKVKSSSSGGYGEKYITRLEWLVRQCADRDLTNAIGKEADRIKAELKAGATSTIAKQIAERVAGMVLK